MNVQELEDVKQQLVDAEETAAVNQEAVTAAADAAAAAVTSRDADLARVATGKQLVKVLAAYILEMKNLHSLQSKV